MGRINFTPDTKGKFAMLNKALAREQMKQYRSPGGFKKTLSSSSGIISLPPSAKSQISELKVLGNTYTNIVSNGNFASTSGWTTDGTATTSAASNTIAVTGTGGYAFAYIKKTLALVAGKKYYASAKVRVTNANCKSLKITIGAFSTTINTPVQNQWYLLSKINTADITNAFLIIQADYADASTASGKAMEVQETITIDLTAHGLDTLTVDQCNQRFPNWFDGTKSTLPARVTSTKNLFDKRKVTPGYYVNPADGKLTASANRESSEYIKVDPNTNYIRTIGADENRRIAFYDENKNFISGATLAVTGIFLTPTNCSYVRTSYMSDVLSKDVIQIIKGTTLGEYTPYASGGQVYTNGVLNSVGNAKDEFSGDGVSKKNVSDTLILNQSWFTKSTTNNPVGVDLYIASNLFTTRGFPVGRIDNNDDLKATRVLVDGVEYIRKKYWANITTVNDYVTEVNLNGTIYLAVPTGQTFDSVYGGKTITINFQLAKPVTRKMHPIGGPLYAYPYGTIMWEPSIHGFLEFGFGETKAIVTTSAVPAVAVYKVLRFDVDEVVDVTADATIGDSGTSLTIANADSSKTYFYVLDPQPGTSTNGTVDIEFEVDGGVAERNYGAAAADWVLSTNESFATTLVCLNAGGAAKIIAPAMEGKLYVIRNASGQSITIKTASSTGVTVANGKTATVIFYGTDFIKTGEV